MLQDLTNLTKAYFGNSGGILFKNSRQILFVFFLTIAFFLKMSHKTNGPGFLSHLLDALPLEKMGYSPEQLFYFWGAFGILMGVYAHPNPFAKLCAKEFKVPIQDMQNVDALLFVTAACMFFAGFQSLNANTYTICQFAYGYASGHVLDNFKSAFWRRFFLLYSAFFQIVLAASLNAGVAKISNYDLVFFILSHLFGIMAFTSQLGARVGSKRA